MRQIFISVILLTLTGCVSTPTPPTSSSVANKVNQNIATLTSDNYFIYSINNKVRIGKGGNKRVFTINEGTNKVEAKLNRRECVGVGSVLSGYRGVCTTKTTGLATLNFRANKGVSYKIVEKPGVKHGTSSPIVINSKTGEIASL